MEKSIKDYIATLGPEERERHKELIAECLAREAANEAVKEKREKNFRGFDIALEKLAKVMESLGAVICGLEASNTSKGRTLH